jgi:AbrB family looped-hinge helix DNA binding protein
MRAFFMIESGITSKGQTTLPKAVREALSVQAGDRVRYVIQEGEVRITPVRPVSRLFGILRHDGPAATLEDMERAIAEGASDA